jgi:pimeloyl-ACP methyl ester carboxylesterase
MLPFIVILIAGYLVVVLLVAVFQRHLIYFPSRAPEEALLELARSTGCRPWRNESGEIIGWRNAESRKEAGGRILILHGNAGYALNRTHYLKALEQVDGGRSWEVILFEYPGFGARSGRPGEKVFLAAGAEAVDQLMREDHRPVYLLGESIGSGPACALASVSDSGAGVILVTPFSSLVDIAVLQYRWLPVRRLLRDRYDNIKALTGYPHPVAVILAGRDEVTPPELGRRLHASLSGPSLLIEQPDAQHNTLDLSPTAPWWNEVSEFLLRRPRDGE